MKRYWNKFLNWLIPKRRERLLAKIMKLDQELGLYEVDMTIDIYDMVRNQFHSQSKLFLNKQESFETAKFIYKLIQKRKEYESNK